MAFFKDQEPSASARGTAEKHRLGARLPLHKPLHVKKGKQFSRGHSYKTGNSLFSKRECIFTLIYNREFKCRKNKLYSRTRHSARMPLPPGRVRHQNQQNPKNLKVSEIPRPGLRHRRGASASPVRTLPTRGSFHRSNSLLRQPASARLLPTLGAGGAAGNGGRLVSRRRCDCPLWATAAAAGWAAAPPSAGTPGAQGPAPPPSIRQGTRLPSKGSRGRRRDRNPRVAWLQGGVPVDGSGSATTLPCSPVRPTPHSRRQERGP